MTLPDNTIFSIHKLRGLDPDNLLAFLALIGFLRALVRSRPEWKPKIYWGGKPPRAMLILSLRNSTPNGVIEAAEQGICELGTTYEFDRPNITFSTREFRIFADSASGKREKAMLIAALASDGAVKRDKKEYVEPTPLCAMFGQGHQDFLSRLKAMATRCDLANCRNLSQALFEPWTYVDGSEGFRWDPIEDRRYALQFGNPSDSKNKVGTVTGANRLAAIGFGLLTCVPTSSGLVTLGVAGQRRERDVCWPLVAVPTTLAGYLALLAHPFIGDEKKAPSLSAYGVTAVARSRRFQVGKYFNFERARVQFF
ncbi:MAG TPA: hypothetical protein P5244_03805 [Syntrophales bacterium]|nr:hypothetical protein [Syntrophales bacterium]